MRSGLTGDDLLWNWARWCWSGETVGNMAAYVSWEDDHRGIMVDHAQAVQEMHAALPWHERMIIIAEYPQKNVMFDTMDAHTRRATARAWIRQTTGVELTDVQYRLYLGIFRSHVEKRLK